MEENKELETQEVKVEAPQKELTFDYNDPDYKKRKKRASIIAVSIVVTLILLFGIVLWVWFFIVNYPIITITHKNIDDLKKEYTLTADGEYISNINYEDYLTYNASVFDGLFSKKIYLKDEGALEGETYAAHNTALIQAILNAVDSSTVIHVDGNYHITSLELKSKTSIIIDEDCSLIGPSYDAHTGISSVIWAKDASNISIYGPGTIVGSGKSYTNEAEDSSIFTPLQEFNVKDRVLEARKRLRTAKSSDVRPHIVYLDNCSDIKIQNVRLHDAAFWTLNIVDSNNVNIKDIVIDNNIHVANADGIDIVSSQKVKVTHCFVATADDGICIKAHGNENVDDVTIERCSVLSMANNVKIGTESSKDVEHIDIMNCYFFMPKDVVGGYSGVAIESADGTNINDVYVDNIYMSGISSPLLIWLGNRLDKKNGSDGVTIGSIKGVTVSNITAKDVEMASAVTGCSVDGISHYIENVKIANFNITYRNTGEKLDLGDVGFEASMNGYPEITRVIHRYLVSHELSVYKDMPVYGLFARHVNGLKVYNLNVQARSCNNLPRDNITQAKDRYDVIEVSVN